MSGAIVVVQQNPDETFQTTTAPKSAHSAAGFGKRIRETVFIGQCGVRHGRKDGSVCEPDAAMLLSCRK